MEVLVDASALLWRTAWGGRDPGERFDELADAWASHSDAAFSSRPPVLRWFFDATSLQPRYSLVLNEAVTRL